MKYELLPETGRGILIERTPVILDIKDTFRVSFLLPENGVFVALFKGKDGIEYKAIVVNGECKIPKELLRKEQLVQLVVSQLDEERIIRSWVCDSLRITAFIGLRQSQRELSGGIADEDIYTRLNELEQLYSQTIAEFKTTIKTIADYKKEVEELAGLKQENQRLAEAYNNSINVINDLVFRLNNLEKHYDPTLI